MSQFAVSNDTNQMPSSALYDASDWGHLLFCLPAISSARVYRNWHVILGSGPRPTKFSTRSEIGMATREDLRRSTFTRLAGLCNKVAECSHANSETATKALELRQELLAFSKWVVPHKTLRQVESEEEALRTRAVNFCT